MQKSGGQGDIEGSCFIAKCQKASPFQENILKNSPELLVFHHVSKRQKHRKIARGEEEFRRAFARQAE
jgi:hypothetical protein